MINRMRKFFSILGALIVGGLGIALNYIPQAAEAGRNLN
jgi:hypothetical protein